MKRIMNLSERFLEIKTEKEIDNDKALEKAIMIIAENINLNNKDLEWLYQFIYNFYRNKFSKISEKEVKRYFCKRYSLEVWKNLNESGLNGIISYILDRLKN